MEVTMSGDKAPKQQSSIHSPVSAGEKSSKGKIVYQKTSIHQNTGIISKEAVRASVGEPSSYGLDEKDGGQFFDRGEE